MSIQVDKSVGVEDVLQKHAIGDVYPWMVENRAGVLGGEYWSFYCLAWINSSHTKDP